MRTGMLQQPQLWAARRLAMRLGLDWPVHMAQTSALKLVYLHSLAGTGYVAPTMVLCIGCLRAATFGDPAAIVWLDASPTVPWVLLAQLCQRIIVDVTLWAARKRGLIKFVMSAHFPPDHPLRNTARRDFDASGYAFVVCTGCMFIYAVILAFLGPDFVTGTRQLTGYSACNIGQDVWVVSVVVSGTTNTSLGC